MKKRRKVVFGFLLASGLAASTLFLGVLAGPESMGAVGRATGPACPRVTGEDGPIPIPYTLTNMRVELADGEQYTLVGRVVIVEGRPYFHVDLGKHPWLSNEARAQNPMYPLVTMNQGWAAWEGQWIRGQFQAVGRVVRLRTGRWVHVISLLAVSEPAPYAGE